MGIPLSEARPDDFSNWGDSNPNPSARIVEPPASLQQAGWVGTQKPPAPYENWINWITQRWTKNLDVRAPRIPLHKWYVGEQSGAHFPTLAAAIASGSVVDGDWIYFSPSAANTTLAAAITVSKSLKIMFEPGTEFTGSAANAFIITANDVELNGASFDDSWDNANDAVIWVTGARLRVIKCNFDTANTRYIDADSVAEADLPILSQNFPDGLLDRQLMDLWTWETGREQVDSIAAATNDLVWTKAFSATFTWAARIPAASVGNRFLELMWMFGEGITLQITDGGANVWRIVPKSNAAFQTHVTAAGETAVSDYKLNLLATGIGVVYDVYRNGVAVANFSTFVSVASGSMTDNTFRAILYGDRAKPTSINGRLVSPAIPRKRWIKLLTGDVINSIPTLSSDIIAYRAAFTKGKQYRFTFNALASVAATAVALRFYNHFSTVTIANELLQELYNTGNGVLRNFPASSVFQAWNDDFSIKTSISFTMDPGDHTIDNHLTFMVAEARFWPQLVIEEV